MLLSPRFQTLIDSIEAELERTGVRLNLRPGDSFQPIIGRFLHASNRALYWPSIGYPVIGDDVKKMLAEIQCEGAVCFPLQGFSTELLYGERIDDVMCEPIRMDVPADPRWIPLSRRFYILLIESESGLAEESKVVGECRECGRIEIEHGDAPFVLSRRHIPTADIFFIKGTQIAVVTDRLASRLRGEFENVELTELNVV